MSLFVLLLLFAGYVSGQNLSVQASGSTNVQTVLQYTAPGVAACSVLVSENPSLDPPVHDVNPGLFPGSNFDNYREGRISASPGRMVAIGRRAVERGADGKWYSRALQADTQHYFQVKCGQQSASGTFRTAIPPVGETQPWPIPQDASGNFRWPSTDNDDRQQQIVDPNYGTLIRRISVPGDVPSLKFDRRKFRSAAGQGWTSAVGAISDDGESATAAGGAGWLALTAADISFPSAYMYGASIDFVVVRVKGSSPGADEESRTIEACLTIDAANCVSDLRTAVLQTASSTVTFGSGKRVDTWGQVLWQHDVGQNSRFGVLIRPAGDGPVSIQYADLDLSMSEMPGMPEAGNFRSCSPHLSNGGYHCSFPGANGSGANVMYWINPQSGEVRWLGSIIASNWGGPTKLCLSPNAPWDAHDPNTYYCVGVLNGNSVLLKGTYTGNDLPAAPGAKAAFQWQSMMPNTSLSQMILAMEPGFEPSKFTCQLGNISGDHAVFGCFRSGQDSYAWIAVFDLGNRLPLGQGGTGRIAALASTLSSPATRWCGLHSFEPLTDGDWIGWTPKILSGGSEGKGPFTVRLLTALPAAQGRFEVSVDGEPQPWIQSAEVGDVFRVSGSAGYDLLKIVEKGSATEWVVDRTVVQAQPSASASGRSLQAFCSARVPDPSVPTAIYWSFLEDSHSLDVTNTTTVVERVLTGSHIVQRGKYRLQQHWAHGYQVVDQGTQAKSWNHPITFNIPSNPKVDGVRAFIGLPEIYQGLEAYQSHPSYENFRAASPGNSWFVDLFPFIGHSQLVNRISRVPGFQQVYKVEQQLKLHQSVFPTVAKCGGRMLRETSGYLTDYMPYTFCIGKRCLPGAAAADTFVNCPAPVSEASRCTQAFSGDASSICISDLPPFGQSVSQFFFDPSGYRTRVLTNALMPIHSPRTVTILDTASALPDGSWVIFPSYSNNARKDLYLVKVPVDPGTPIPDSNWTTSVPVLVSPPSSQTISQAAGPFGAGELARETSRVPCRSGCTVLRPAIRSIRNAASLDSRIAPGGLAFIDGEHLASCKAETADLPAPLRLCESEVRVNGIPAPLLFASPSRISFQLPPTVKPGTNLLIIAGPLETPSEPATVNAADVLDAVPALFSYSLDGRVQRALAVDSGGAIAGPVLEGGALRRAETAVLYANSLGLTDPAPPPGQPAPKNPPAALKTGLEVYINEIPQTVRFAGLVPGGVGVYKIDFEVDAETPILAEDDNRIWIRIEGRESARLVIHLQP